MCKKVLGTALTVAGVVTGNPYLAAAGQAASAVSSASAAKKADSRQADAAKQAAASTQAQLNLQTQALNKADAKAPNIAALLAANTSAATPATSLSGPGGVSSSSLKLGKNTILGQ